MDVAYGEYKYVLLDASSLMFPIPDELWERFEDDPALIAKTFDSEYKAYKNLFPNRTELTENYEKIRCKVDFENMFREDDYRRMELNRDAMGLLRLLCGSVTRHVSEQRSCLLVTGDLSQLQYVSTYAVPADILYLRENRLFTEEDTEELKNWFIDRGDEEWDLVEFVHGYHVVAYRENGDPIPLTFKQDNKESSRIYKTGDGRYAKIFHKERLTLRKIRHVEMLIKFRRQLSDAQLELDWLLLPMELLYADPEGEDPVGYLMMEAVYYRKLEDMIPVSMDIGGGLWGYNYNVSYGRYLFLAWLITHHVSYLKTYNLWPSDFNLENFALCEPTQENSDEPTHYRKLYMWDTDSVCWNGYMDCYTSKGRGKHRYYSDRWAKKLVPPESRSKKYRMEEACANALYQCVFYVLSLGGYPYGTERRPQEWFYFDWMEQSERDHVFLIPENLRRLFHDVFVCGYTPSVPCLLYELEKAAESGQITLEERYQKARELNQPGAGFRPEKKTKIVDLPKPPAVPEVSATLSRWVRNTARFQGARERSPVTGHGFCGAQQETNEEE